MFKRSIIGLVSGLLFCWVPSLEAQAQEDRAFRQAMPGYSYQFPGDHYSHDDFRIEWWYYTGNLEDAEGRSFGYQLTFFRVGLEGTQTVNNPSKWKVDQIYFAHMTVSDVSAEKFHFFERINRRGILNAGAKSDRFLVWNEDWILTEQGGGHRLKALEGGTGLDLKLIPEKNLVIHGKEGISRKGQEAGNASHYFSFTRMKTLGNIFIAGRPYEVRGTSWMDREYSSNPLNEELSGWDWFSLKLDNHTELMLYQLRRKDGGTDPYSSGTLVREDGTWEHLEQSKFSIVPTGKWTSEHTGATYPAGWEISLTTTGDRFTVTPDLADQELFHLRSISGSYWEGSVSVRGTVSGEEVRGKGYVELVGYQNPLKQELPE